MTPTRYRLARTTRMLTSMTLLSEPFIVDVAPLNALHTCVSACSGTRTQHCWPFSGSLMTCKISRGVATPWIPPNRVKALEIISFQLTRSVAGTVSPKLRGVSFRRRQGHVRHEPLLAWRHTVQSYLQFQMQVRKITVIQRETTHQVLFPTISRLLVLFVYLVKRIGPGRWAPHAQPHCTVKQ